MSLLREIQDAAINPEISLSTLLRKCIVLAARLSSQELKTWTENELTGYKNNQDLPDYRILQVNSKGNFYSSMTAAKHLPIPLHIVPEEFREQYSHAYISIPIASLENLVATPGDGAAKEPWNPTAVAVMSQSIYQNMNCLQAWKEIPINALNGILDIVRTRVLNFALEIESENPEAGDAPLNSNPLPQEKLHNIVHNNIYGGNVNLAINSHDTEQSNNITGNSDEIFVKLLKTIEHTELKLKIELSSLIDDMKRTQRSASFKEHYIKFTETVATHAQILGTGIIPLLPALAHLIK